MKSKIRTFLIVSAVVIAIDHIAKWVVKSTMEVDQTIRVIGDLFTLYFTYNTGIAFGLFDANSSRLKMPLLVVISIIALAIILYIFFSLPKRVRLSGLAMGLIFGGAIGNMIDRIAQGRVIDFLDVDFPDIAIKPLGIYLTRWPTFNVADSCVLVGIVMLLVIIVAEGGRPEPRSADEPAPSNDELYGPRD
jgi:signal peptidase II